MLERIRALSAMLPRREFTTAEIATLTDVAPGTVGQIVQRERRRGYLESIGQRPRPQGSTGGAPETVYRVKPDRVRKLGSELDMAMHGLLPKSVMEAAGAMPEALVIAEAKLTDGLGVGAAAIRAANETGDAAAVSDAASDFAALLKSIGPDLSAAERVVAKSDMYAPRLAAARDAWEQANAIAGPIGNNQNPFPQHAEIAALVGASHAASIAAVEDPCFAGNASLRWGGRLASGLVDQLDEGSTEAHRQGVRLVKRFMQVSGKVKPQTGMVVIDGIGDASATVATIREALEATGVHSVSTAGYDGSPLACRILVVGHGRPTMPTSDLRRMIPDGVDFCIIDEGNGGAALLSDRDKCGYFSVAASTPGATASKLFEAVAAVRTDVCAPIQPFRSHHQLSTPENIGFLSEFRKED
jgi:hypothetical protein